MSTRGIDHMMARLHLKYVTTDRDRHGNIRYYFRRGEEKKIRLRGDVGSAEFMAAYAAALANEPKPEPEKPKVEKPQPGTFEALCLDYYASHDFKRLDPATQSWRRQTLDRIAGEKPGALAKDMQTHHVKKLRDAIAHTPAAANKRLKALNALYVWAIEHDKAKTNPALGVRPIKYQVKGHHSWTAREMRRYVERHPFGTKAYLAFAILAHTAGRREDAVRLGPQHMVGNRLQFTQAKNEHRSPVEIDIPIHPVLLSALVREDMNAPAFLVTEYGRPFSAPGFGNKFREWCDEAGLEHCSAHGLRKAAAALLAEAGATPHEIMAVTGHRSLEEVERYTKAARKALLADRAFARLALSHQEKDGGTVSGANPYAITVPEIGWRSREDSNLRPSV